MKSGRVAPFIILLFGIGPGLTTPANCSAQNEKDSLSQYEEAGPYVVPPSGPRRAQKKAEIRDFIWVHWHKHRLARLITTQVTKEGVSCFSTLLVQPDERGIWSVKVTMEWQGDSRNPHISPVEYQAYSVERISIPSEGKEQVVPDEASLSPDTYRLILKDKQSKVLTEL